MIGIETLRDRPSISILFIFIGVLTFVNVGIFIYQLYIGFTIPARFGYVEPYVIHQSINWEVMFSPIDTQPYIVTNFPPVYLFLTGAINAIFNAPFFSARLVSAVGTTIVAVFIALIVKKSSPAETQVAVLAGLIYLLGPYVTSSGATASPDNLGMAISMGAIYWFLTREGKSKIVGAAFFAAVAPLAKQSLLGAPVGIFLALLWKRKLKQAAIFASIVGIVGFGTLGILTILTDGRAWLHLVEYNSNELQISRMVEMTYFFITRHTATLVLGSLTALFYFDEMPRVAVTYTIATGVSVALTAKVGSDVLYYYPFLSAMSILAGIYLGHTFPNGLLESINRPIDCERFREPLIALLLVATLLLTGISPPNDNAHGSVEAAEFLDSVDGDVLAEDAGVLISSDRPVHYQPYIFNRLRKQGVWNETPFVTSIQQKKYDYVVLTGSANSSSGWFTPRQRRAVNDNYKLHKRFEDYYVYIPATTAKSPLSVT